MRTSGRRKAITLVAGAALAVALLVPATAAVAGSVEDEGSMTLVVEIPARTASPTPSPSSTPEPSATPGSSSAPDPNNQAGGALPPTGGESLLWLLLVGGSVTAAGLVARRAARGRHSSTAPRS